MIPRSGEEAVLIGSQALARAGGDTGPPTGDTLELGSHGVVRLTLTDFRCYRYQRIETDRRPVVLTGANGAGKTNVLEALSFLVPGRGLRGARLAEVAFRPAGGGEHGGAAASAPSWAVAATLSTPLGDVEIGTGLEGGAAAGGRDRRVVRVDGRPEKSQAALARVLSAVWVTPWMDRLFVEGASGRRRFLDRLVFGFDPAHAGRVGAYDHARRERTKLLRQGGGDRAWLAALEDTMATKGVAVTAARVEMAARLDRACARGVGPFPGAAVRMAGTVVDWLAEGPALAAEERLREGLETARARDAETGGASLGPHRDDFGVRHLDKDEAAERCSTGEQKALLLALVLAHARLLAEERGAPPLLLLDEVAAHLDRQRREALLEEILALGAQAWLAGTDASLFATLDGRARFLRVENARVVPA